MAALGVGFTDNAVELFSFAMHAGDAALAQSPAVLVPTLRVRRFGWHCKWHVTGLAGERSTSS